MSEKMSNVSASAAAPEDAWGRAPRYLRLSITDRCNFNCLYCGDSGRRQYIPHNSVLRYEEMLRFARAAQKLGVGKIRVTGGEPFARKNCMEFMAALRAEFPGMLLSATTNGSLIGPFIPELCRLGLASINISLDSFDRESFKRVTGADALPEVLRNIDSLLAAGQRVKLNAVAMRGITDAQAADFLHAVKAMPVDLRFIELMPMGSALMDGAAPLAANELMRLLGRHATLTPVQSCADAFSGPARMWSVAGAKGRIGFIQAISNHFCNSCNRLRLTCDGHMRLCLFGGNEYRMAPLLKHASDGALVRAISHAWNRKPLGHEILRGRQGKSAASRPMAAIGG